MIKVHPDSFTFLHSHELHSTNLAALCVYQNTSFGTKYCKQYDCLRNVSSLQWNDENASEGCNKCRGYQAAHVVREWTAGLRRGMKVHPVQLQPPSPSSSRGWRAGVGHKWDNPLHHHPSPTLCCLPASERRTTGDKDLSKSILFLMQILNSPSQLHQCRRSRGCWGYSRRQSRVLKAHLPVGRQVYFLCPLFGMNPGRQVYSTSSPTSYTFLSTLRVANSTSGGLGQTGGKEVTRHWVENWSCFYLLLYPSLKQRILYCN